MAYVYCHQAEVLGYLGEYAQSRTMCEKARQLFQQTGDAIGEAYVQLVQAGDIDLAFGWTAPARPALETVLRIMRECGNVEQSMYALLDLAECGLLDHDLQAAEACLRQIDELGPAPLPVWPLSIRDWLEGRLALAQGDYDRATQKAQNIEQWIKAGSAPDILGPMWMLRAQVAQARGNRQEAGDCFERAIQAVQARGSFVHKLFILKEASAFLVTDPDSAATARPWLEEAAAMQRHLDAERERCRTLPEAAPESF